MDKWRKAPLSDIIQFKNGKKRPSSVGTIPVYGGNGVLDFTDASNNENSVIIGRVGAYCGSVYYEVKSHWVSDNAISAVNKEHSNIIFDYYLLKSLDLNQRHIGTSQPLLTQEILNSIEVLIPPLDEQIEIGRTLRVLDDKIANNTRINHHLCGAVQIADLVNCTHARLAQESEAMADARLDASYCASPRSETDSSPDIRRGNRASRMAARLLLSRRLFSICPNKGSMVIENSYREAIEGSSIGN